MKNLFINSRKSGKSLIMLDKLRDAWERGLTTMSISGVTYTKDEKMTYDFRCKSCNKYFEEILAYDEMETKKIRCPKCKSTQVCRAYISPPKIIFKGSGFYSTDNKKDKNV